MDEVDGMAGNEDRGGIQVKPLWFLVNAIAKSVCHVHHKIVKPFYCPQPMVHKQTIFRVQSGVF